MAQTSIEIDAGLAEAIARQAQTRGMSVDAYLRALVEDFPSVAPQADLTVAEFEQVLDELLIDVSDLPVLPPGFSRADSYGDHD